VVAELVEGEVADEAVEEVSDVVAMDEQDRFR
jgi:hypothetical protein